MPTISYVYPNVSGIAQRGSLGERWELAEPLGCTYVEMPADFIKNRTEVRKTNLEICSVLTPGAIEMLYEADSQPGGRYILRTEPSLPRTDGCCLRSQAPLRWYDAGWRKSFIMMVIGISAHLGLPPAKIEIHPGDRRNSYADIANGVNELIEGFAAVFGCEPEILLENRTGQCVQDGTQVREFWECVEENYPDLAGRAGIVLDVQQLYTVKKQAFLDSFDEIPVQALKGFHIHAKHRVPSIDDPVPWQEVFLRIGKISQDIIINPEIHHKRRVFDAIRFCREMLAGDGLCRCGRDEMMGEFD